MKKLNFLSVIVVLFSFLSYACAGQGQTLADFDEDASICRRVVRKYCTVVQEMMGEKSVDPQKQKNGLELLDQAQNS